MTGFGQQPYGSSPYGIGVSEPTQGVDSLYARIRVAPLLRNEHLHATPELSAQLQTRIAEPELLAHDLEIAPELRFRKFTVERLEA